MRHARLKPDYQDTWHHCYNRVVGTRDDRPFGDAAEEAARPPGAPDVPAPCGFLLTARRRVRHWADGLVIGSELFMREAVRRARPSAAKPSHRLARSEPAPGTPETLFCWRRLRLALE